jgi:predicted site-specific integrase-resolvase
MSETLNLTQSCKKVGISRVTIGRHIKSGKLSTVTGRDGKIGVHVSELLRVYGEFTDDIVTKDDDTGLHSQCNEINQLLKNQIRSLEEDKRNLNEQIFKFHSTLENRQIENKSGSENKPKKGKKSKKGKRGRKK